MNASGQLWRSGEKLSTYFFLANWDEGITNISNGIDAKYRQIALLTYRIVANSNMRY